MALVYIGESCYSNFSIFFEKLIKSVGRVINKYDNFIVTCDFNIGLNKDEGKEQLFIVFSGTLSFINFIHHKSTIEQF